MRAKKHFGQHFLHDPYIIKRIVDAIGPSKAKDLIEIGPGQGALTDHIIEPSKNLHVIEIDPD
jgi:dimethyladenosine transferase (EC 2.1.1.-)